MLNDIKIEYDNDLVTIIDGNRIVTKGKGVMFDAMAKNIINNPNYNVSEQLDGHKKVVTLHAKH